ncbi:TIGR03668 family PPOX class F420-dependent oxidoreductase [Rhodococcus hoagii]|nr:TIGR03668 family PPOX class F420-dependent oxidoreductase [Prescottella equi]MBM4668882.1 TIGR03668 family PPOX class F420-dependent oxidoreductase [Prescottella equi]MCD7050713.1 TIGR03668 family PPOX class F420-dependent oxidoreductase [Rhodococcus sp. BH2-1]NKV89503.1 TIGR03668 family PPOX class F420-dependent oxidoreductase [Prescottella equi]
MAPEMPGPLPSRFVDAPVARMATVSADGDPHLVPVVFAAVGDVVFTAVDDKPKSTRRLRRLANIAATGRASLLVDHYDDDWSRLWWIRVDGTGEVLEPDSDVGVAAIDALVAKYHQYASMRPIGPVIEVRVSGWREWSAS